jgi:hypothetical protein
MSISKETPAPTPVFVVADSDFDPELTVGGAGASEKIDMHECATFDAAERLLAHFSTIGLTEGRIVHDLPLGSFVQGSPFAQSGKVPYINLPRVPTADNPSKAHHVNAAHMLTAYAQYPPKFADTLMLQKYGPVQ